MIVTSIAKCLLPEDAAEVLHPSLFHVRMGGFHNDRLVGLPLAEPNLKARTGIAHLGREANVGSLHALLVDVNIQVLPLRIPFRLAKQDEILEEEHVSQSLLAALPAVELVLTQQSALLLHVHVAVAQRVHGEQVVTVAKLEADHLLGGDEVRVFRLLVRGRPEFLEQLFEQQGVLAHPLDRLEEVAGQVHLVSELGLFAPEEGRPVFGHEGVRLGLVLVVQGVEVKVLFVSQEALADEVRDVVAASFQLSQKVVVVEAVDLFQIAEDDVPLAAHRLRDVFP